MNIIHFTRSNTDTAVVEYLLFNENIGLIYTTNPAKFTITSYHIIHCHYVSFTAIFI